MYGLWPYPGANHIGEYISWADEFFAGRLVQYYYDPMEEDPWKTGNIPDFIYSLSFGENPLTAPLFPEANTGAPDWKDKLMNETAEEIKPSHEVVVPIMEAIAFDVRTELNAVNVQNKGMIPGLPEDMVVELPAFADGTGIHTIRMEPLPEGTAEMIRIQGTIHKLLIEAYTECSRKKLLQAMLLDPTATSYRN